MPLSRDAHVLTAAGFERGPDDYDLGALEP